MNSHLEAQFFKINQDLELAEQEIDKLKAELGAAKADNARLAAAVKEYERTEPLKKAENKSLCDRVWLLESQLHGCLCDAYSLNDGHEWGITRAIKNRMDDAQCAGLRDLLAPTIELLDKISCHFPHQSIQVANELQRLRALCGEGKQVDK